MVERSLIHIYKFVQAEQRLRKIGQRHFASVRFARFLVRLGLTIK